MKRKLIAAAAIAALFSAPAWAQMGPGMMGGFGSGGFGMGPGMMGGYGMGPGMMGGYGPGGGYGMGPGMMGGYGAQGMGPGMMGPGMMGGYGAQGMGPGMMGPGMMGPGMMGGYGAYAGLNLSDEQRAKIAEIQQDVSRKQWELMGKMREQGFQMHRFDAPGTADDSAARKAYQAMADARKAMFENSLDARKRVDAVLTKEQREQMQRNRGCG